MRDRCPVWLCLDYHTLAYAPVKPSAPPGHDAARAMRNPRARDLSRRPLSLSQPPSLLYQIRIAYATESLRRRVSAGLEATCLCLPAVVSGDRVFRRRAHGIVTPQHGWIRFGSMAMNDRVSRGRDSIHGLTRRDFAKGALAWGTAPALALSGCGRSSARETSAAGRRRPNVVFMLTDDQRWDELGCEGHPFLKTPNLDRIAAEGARFANMFVTTSLCSPSRASFLSGLYAHSHGVVNNFTDYPHDLPSFPANAPGRRLRDGLHRQVAHGRESDERRPGFDLLGHHKGQGQYYDTEFNVNGQRHGQEGLLHHRVTDMAIDWLGREHDKPFLLILGHKAPHTPFTPEEKYRHIYDDMPIEYPETGLPPGGQARLGQTADRHLARHLRPDLRIPQEIPRPRAPRASSISPISCAPTRPRSCRSTTAWAGSTRRSKNWASWTTR